MMYEPRPINTEDIELDEDILELQELIAKNVHEVWAQGRITEGWVWGENKDNGERTHPDLIPYEELPEEEKDYDRKTAMETLKLIMKLGYRITREG